VPRADKIGRYRRDNRAFRVLHFLCTPVRAGVGEHALSLLIGLRNADMNPYIVAPAPLLESVEKELREFGIVSLPMDMSSPLDWREIVRLASFLRKESIDIVHCHMAIASFCAAPIAWWSGVPVVIETSHGREIWRQGKFFKGSFWFDRQIGRLINRYIAVSGAAADHLINNKRIPEHKITVIHNGRDLTHFQPPSASQTIAARRALKLHDEPTILMLSRFSAEKGHRLLLDAIVRLLPRWPRLVVLLAGDGPLENEIRERCRSAHLENNVRFLGYRSDPHELFAASDLVVLPSAIEGLPLAAVEALAAGRPVVATAVGGTPEVVIDGETGLLSKNDANQFAAAIEQLLADPVKRIKMARRGRALVERRFDVRIQVEKTFALYRRELTARRSSRSVSDSAEIATGRPAQIHPNSRSARG
jgi:glycosyltransferase involved in cell wall biosynthesis